MNEDSDLLSRYAKSHSEEAFAELVRRRVGLVYSVALRRTHDSQRAEDATQTVFTTLARKADALSKRPVLVGWLYHAAHNAATDIVRAEISRAVREREAQTMQEISATDGPAVDWEKVRPVLDHVLSELDSEDRDAVLLRFFDGRPFADIGQRLHLSENTARMRVERALDKLQALLATRGITSTGAALSAALAQQGLVAAPAGLVAAVVNAAIGGGATTAASASTFIGLVMHKNTLVIGAVVAVAVGLVVTHSKTQGRAGTENPVSAPLVVRQPQAIDPPRTETANPPTNARVSGSQPAVVRQAPAPSPTPGEPAASAVTAPPTQQQRAIMNNLRMIVAGRDYFLKSRGRLPESLAELVGPENAIRELKPVNGEDYTTVQLGGRTLSVATADGTTVTLQTEGPVAKGPPSLAESTEWQNALLSYLRSRTGPATPQIPKPAAKIGPEFVGVRDVGDGTTLALTDATTSTAQWLKVGQKFGPYVITEYWAPDEVLILQREGKTIQLKLRDSKIVARFALEAEMAYLAIQEVVQREGWPASSVRVQKPVIFKSQGNEKPAPREGDWSVFVSRILEKDEQHVVVGEQVHLFLTPQGQIDDYLKLKPRQ